MWDFYCSPLNVFVLWLSGFDWDCNVLSLHDLVKCSSSLIGESLTSGETRSVNRTLRNITQLTGHFNMILRENKQPSPVPDPRGSVHQVPGKVISLVTVTIYLFILHLGLNWPVLIPNQQWYTYAYARNWSDHLGGHNFSSGSNYKQVLNCSKSHVAWAFFWMGAGAVRSCPLYSHAFFNQVVEQIHWGANLLTELVSLHYFKSNCCWAHQL